MATTPQSPSVPGNGLSPTRKSSSSSPVEPQSFIQAKLDALTYAPVQNNPLPVAVLQHSNNDLSSPFLPPHANISVEAAYNISGLSVSSMTTNVMANSASFSSTLSSADSEEVAEELQQLLVEFEDGARVRLLREHAKGRSELLLFFTMCAELTSPVALKKLLKQAAAEMDVK